MTLILGDSFERLKRILPNSIDAVVTDPPYGLAFMNKHWDYDVPSVELWREVLRVMKPGAHLLSFGGTKTYHRMVVAIEDAGFEIRDQVQWIYGSGFPKSLDVSKAIDKQAGARGHDSVRFNAAGDGEQSNGGSKFRSDHPEYVKPSAVTNEAKQWQGWGTALKPAFEPLVVARKPLTSAGLLANLALECQSKLFAEIVTRYSSLSLNEKTRQSIAPWLAGKSTLTSDVLSEVMATLQSAAAINSYLSTELSWLDTLDAVWTHANTCTTEMASSLITDLKILKSLLSSNTRSNTPQSDGPVEPLSVSLAANLLNALALKLNYIHEPFVQDSATKSDALENLRPKNEPIVLARKPLEKGLTVAENVLKWHTGAINVDASRIVTDDGANRARPPRTENAIYGNGSGTNLTASEHNSQGRWPSNLLFDEEAAAMLDEQSGVLKSGGGDKSSEKMGYHGGAKGCGPKLTEPSSGGASRFFYVAKASKRERNAGMGEQKNGHPTIKPIKLMEYLVRMITPPNGVVLDPFTGSGSTGVAALKLGFQFIGIEREAEYLEIARKRIESISTEELTA